MSIFAGMARQAAALPPPQQQAAPQRGRGLFGGGRPSVNASEVLGFLIGGPGYVGNMRQGQRDDIARQERSAAVANLNHTLTSAGQGAGQGAGGGQGGLMTLRQAAPALLAAQQAGIDTGDYVNLLDKAGPQVAFERGFRYDQRDPTSAPQYAPNLGEGQAPTMDGGQVTSVANIPGYSESRAITERGLNDARNASTASYAGAIAEASAAGDGRGGAPYQIETVQGPRGNPITMSRADLLASGPIVGQSASEQAAATDLAKGAAGRQLEAPQAAARMESARNSAANLRSTVEQAISQIGWQSTGIVGAATGFIPGSESKDLRKTIETIKANVGFDYLQQMRELSPTGGALGNVAIQELLALQSVFGNLDPDQSPEQLKRNLEQILKIVDQGLNTRQSAYESQFGGSGGAPQGQQPQGQSVDRSALEAEARRRGLIQ